jgi:hypothetical protein
MEQPTYPVLDQFFYAKQFSEFVKYDVLILFVVVLFFKQECWLLCVKDRYGEPERGWGVNGSR